MPVNVETKIGKFGALINKIYQNTAPLLLGEAALFVIMAVLMIIKPVEILSAVTFVVGGVLVLFGLYRVSMVFVSNLGLGVGSFDAFFGLVTMILGIVFLAYPNGAALGVIYVFVVLFLLNSLRLLFFAVNMVRMQYGHYIVDLVGAIVMVCLSVVLLFLPGAAIGIVMFFLALYLLLYAVADVYMFWKLLCLRRDVRKLR